MINPLLLPELLAEVARYVDSLDWVSCSQVCWTWHTHFNPLVWKTCVINSATKTPPIHALTTYAHHIRKLDYLGLLFDYFPRYLNLEILDISTHSHTSADYQAWMGTMALIRETPSLSAVRLSGWQSIPAVGIWDAIRENRQVTRLALSHINISFTTVAPFLQACTTLEELELNGCIIWNPWRSHVGSLWIPKSLPRLQHIRWESLINIRGEDQVRLMALCPEIRSIYWRGGVSGQFPMNVFLEHLTAGAFPNLESLDVLGRGIHDSTIEAVVKRMKPMKTLNFVQTEFGRASLDALQLHYQTLQELNLTQCHQVKSADIMKLLRSCPLLTMFKAETLTSSNVDENERWACAERLRELVLYFELDGHDPRSESQRVFECLSNLTALRRLNISKYNTQMSRQQTSSSVPLQLRLDHGMGQLSTLKHLEAIYFNMTDQTMTMNEGMWMKRNWRCLSLVRGRFSLSPHVNMQLEQLFMGRSETFAGRCGS
ncbi:hypothetical protein EDD21DRAFT_199200 [Dissophora ornata]|nr:hypothetical protein BGZ58_005230 [Dissophora ornata]KAI8604675.1 hypothetical protein EDD21DRAFT_199200 [Dissophora ornata]